MPKHDTSEPILVLIRRGRKGRGFSISPVEDIANAAACATTAEVGEVIEEMLDDENQPRVDINELLQAATGGPQKPKSKPSAAHDDAEEDEDEDDDEEDDDEEEEHPSSGSGSILDGVAEAKDPADQIMINLLSWGVNKGRSMSSKKVRVPTRPKKKKKKTKTR